MITSDFEVFRRDVFQVQLENMGGCASVHSGREIQFGRVGTSGLIVRGSVCILGKRLGQVQGQSLDMKDVTTNPTVVPCTRFLP